MARLCSEPSGGELTCLGPLHGTTAEPGLPLALEAVAAGFPSPAEDYVEATIDLNAALVPHPTATFLMRVEGDAMHRAGIHHGDLLVIDRSVAARPGCTVVAVHEGNFVLRRVSGEGRSWLLVASDPAIAPIPLQDGDSDLVIWGVVIHAVHHLLPRQGRSGALTRNPWNSATPPTGPSAETQRP